MFGKVRLLSWTASVPCKRQMHCSGDTTSESYEALQLDIWRILLVWCFQRVAATVFDLSTGWLIRPTILKTYVVRPNIQ